MPAKRPRRFRFIGNKIMSNRTAAIALIVVCIVGTAIRSPLEARSPRAPRRWRRRRRRRRS